MKSAIPHTIFLLAGKTVKSLITQEIAKLIIQSVIYTGIIIGVLFGGVKLYLGFTEVVEWVPKFIDTAIDDFTFTHGCCRASGKRAIELITLSCDTINFSAPCFR